MLTGKAKEDFERYFISEIRQRSDIGDRYTDEMLLENLYHSDFNIQFAYAQKFFDISNVIFWIAPYFNHDLGVMNKWAGFNDRGVITIECDNRHLANIESIKEAVKIYNNRNNYN